MDKLTFDWKKITDLKVPPEALFREHFNSINTFKLFQVDEGRTEVKWTLVKVVGRGQPSDPVNAFFE